MGKIIIQWNFMWWINFFVYFSHVYLFFILSRSLEKNKQK